MAKYRNGSNVEKPSDVTSLTVVSSTTFIPIRLGGSDFRGVIIDDMNNYAATGQQMSREEYEKATTFKVSINDGELTEYGKEWIDNLLSVEPKYTMIITKSISKPKTKKLRLPRKLKKYIKLINIRHEGVFLEWSIGRIAWSILNEPFYKKHYRNKKQYRTTKYKKL